MCAFIGTFLDFKLNFKEYIKNELRKIIKRKGFLRKPYRKRKKHPLHLFYISTQKFKQSP